MPGTPSIRFFAQINLLAAAARLGLDAAEVEKGICFGLMAVWFDYVEQKKKQFFYDKIALLSALQFSSIQLTPTQLRFLVEEIKPFLEEVIEAQKALALKKMGLQLHYGCLAPSIKNDTDQSQLAVFLKQKLSENNFLYLRVLLLPSLEAHAIGIAYREGRYHLYDANCAEEEDSFDNIEAVVKEIVASCQRFTSGHLDRVQLQLHFYEKNSHAPLMYLIDMLEKFPLPEEARNALNHLKLDLVAEKMSTWKCYTQLEPLIERLLADPYVYEDKVPLIRLNAKIKQRMNFYENRLEAEPALASPIPDAGGSPPTPSHA